MHKKMLKYLPFLLIQVLLLSACSQKTIDDYLYVSNYLKTEIAGFTLVENRLTYDLSFSERQEIPKGSVAVITYENLEPCGKPITVREPVVFNDEIPTLGRKLFSIRSPTFAGARPDTAFTVNIWLVHDGEALGHHMERVKFKFSSEELQQYGVLPVYKCITKA